jgi:hypothetical protein
MRTEGEFYSALLAEARRQIAALEVDRDKAVDAVFNGARIANDQREKIEHLTAALADAEAKIPLWDAAGHDGSAAMAQALAANKEATEARVALMMLDEEHSVLKAMRGKMERALKAEISALTTALEDARALLPKIRNENEALRAELRVRDGVNLDMTPPLDAAQAIMDGPWQDHGSASLEVNGTDDWCLRLATNGWSENEEMAEKFSFFFMTEMVMYARGGLYIFGRGPLAAACVMDFACRMVNDAQEEG